jgi:hypothetical protein
VAVQKILMQLVIVPRAEGAAHAQESAVLDFRTDGLPAVAGVTTAEWIFHGEF